MSSGSVPGVGVLMFIAYRAMEQRIFDAMRADGFDGTLAQGRLFARLDDVGMRLTDLADSAQVTKQTAGALVDQLEAKGLVERVPDPSDGRARLVRISAPGRIAQARAREIENRVVAEWTAHLGRRDMTRLREILGRLRTITDPYETPATPL